MEAQRPPSLVLERSKSSFEIEGDHGSKSRPADEGPWLVGYQADHQCTILERAISKISVAPFSLSDGMRVFISSRSTTASTAYPLPPASSDTVGDLSEGSPAITEDSLSAATF